MTMPLLLVSTPLLLVLLLARSSSSSFAFVPSPLSSSVGGLVRRGCIDATAAAIIERRSSWVRFLSSSEDGDGKDNSNVNDMRRLLESSWDEKTMGIVPTNVHDAADAAIISLQNAVERAEVQEKPPIFYVDVLLPQYDIRQGSNVYDEVLAVEFCIELSNRLLTSNSGGETLIVVRDDQTVQTVNRILDARRKLQEEEQEERTTNISGTGDDSDGDTNDTAGAISLTPSVDDDEDEDEDDDDSNDILLGSPDDDDNDNDDGDDDDDTAPADRDGDSVQSFRDRLIEDWGNADDNDVDDTTNKSSDGGDNKEVRLQGNNNNDNNNNNNNNKKPSTRKWRLASLFGSEADNISSGGPDMIDKVIKAVSANAQPNDDEDTIIILSATCREEMIGVRGLVGKYGGRLSQKKKNVILVNCNFNPPYPRELTMAQPVYSITPFIARPKAQQQTVSSSSQPQQPKVVILRRYPRDWEVFVDCGDGFELARTVPPEKVDNKGPTMQFIASAVKMHLEARRIG